MKQVRTRGKQLRPLLDAVKWVLLWITVALAAAAMMWSALGQELALQFLGGYLIELSLSMDNLFVFMSIFTAFGIAEHARHRVLHWGILGAVVLRLLFILLGSAIIGRFAWVLYLFGALLVVNGAKMLMGEEAEKDVKRSPVMTVIRHVLPMTDSFRGEKFFVRERLQKGRHTVLRATPLFGVLLLIECSDIIFAIDSVPAAFSISTHPLIVYTSNILAILGLRQLYFVLEYVTDRFRYVRYGVAVILMFTGLKMLAVLVGIHIGTTASILVILSVLLGSILLSVLLTGRCRKKRFLRERMP